ncbi:hypothetical protein LBMAG46_16650 [Planctomycetia bacterium]|nr:hypothetical protein LBMAG46_16650 [Planctomycetia bacterium]
MGLICFLQQDFSESCSGGDRGVSPGFSKASGGGGGHLFDNREFLDIAGTEIASGQQDSVSIDWVEPVNSPHHGDGLSVDGFDHDSGGPAFLDGHDTFDPGVGMEGSCHFFAGSSIEQ